MTTIEYETEISEAPPTFATHPEPQRIVVTLWRIRTSEVVNGGALVRCETREVAARWTHTPGHPSPP